jgi:hypothetical protein
VSARDLRRLLEHPDPPQLEHQLREIVESRIYMQVGVEVRPGDVVLDVGANIGLAAAFFAAECGTLGGSLLRASPAYLRAAAGEGLTNSLRLAGPVPSTRTCRSCRSQTGSSGTSPTRRSLEAETERPAVPAAPASIRLGGQGA